MESSEVRHDDRDKLGARGHDSAGATSSRPSGSRGERPAHTGVPAQAAPAETLRSIFDTWSAVDAVLERLATKVQLGPEEGQMETRLQELLTRMARLVTCLPAASMQDLALKMALWRRDIPDDSMRELQRADAIAYSVFRDLVVLSRDDSLLSGGDDR